jgi:BlaI family penicillinase repressor
MAKRPKLAKSEIEIARVVWQLGEATVRQVVDALPEDRALDFWTAQTYLRRLKAKGYLTVRREGRSNVYRPGVRPGNVVRELVSDFVDRLFAGQALPLVQHLVSDHDLSAAEIDSLQQMLNELKRKRKS